MKFKKYLLFNILIALVIASSLVVFSQKGFLKRLELVGLDLFFRSRATTDFNPHIVIVEIDDRNISQVGRWPWKRSWHAAIIKSLKEMGARIIYFDIIFSESSSEQEDNILSQAIAEAGNVYLPFVFQEYSQDINDAFLPIDKFSSYIKGTGSMNIYPDIDGSLRRIPLVFGTEHDKRYHVALQIAADYLGFKVSRINDKSIILEGEKNTLEIPLAEKNSMLINWSGKWKDTFVHYSFLDILGAYKNYLEGRKNELDLEPLKDSICLVGVTAIGLYDIKPIPLEPAYPGLGFIANTISNILERNFLKAVPLWFNWLVIYILALIPALLISGERSLRESLFSTLAAVSFFIISYLFFRENLWIDISKPLLSLFSSYLTVTSYNLVRISMERKNFFELAVTDELTRLYNIRYFKMILKAECFIARAEAIRKFCIVMTDVDHFKHFNDTYGHQVGDLVLREVADALKTSVRSSDIVARYGGEEMIILLRGTSLENALIVAEKIRNNVELREVKDQNNTYKVTISLGVASFNSTDDEEAIIKRADSGLYKAKDSGRNRVETQESGIEEISGIYNQERFIKILKAECQLAKAEVKKKLCLILSQFDNIDAFGSGQEKDTVIKEVLATLKSLVRSSDIVARLSQDRMAIFLNGASLEDGLAVAEKIRKNIEKIQVKGQVKVARFTVSLGLTNFRYRDDENTLIKRAENALDKAREEGGNRTRMPAE